MNVLSPRIVSAARMRAIEARLFAELRIDPLVLMEAAGRAVATEVLALGARRVHVVCGKGNNGGDGLVAARVLHAAGVQISVSLIGAPLSAQNQAQKSWCEASGVGFTSALALACAGADVVIDALLGIGVRQPLSSELAETVHILNLHSKRIVAVDVPSGLADGAPGEAIRAERTVTFAALKRELTGAVGRHHAGVLSVAAIGIPDAYFDDHDGRWLDEAFARARYSAKSDQPNAHKGTFGHAVLIGGASGKNGALFLAALGAYRSGAGLVTAMSPDVSHDGGAALPPEVMRGESFPEKTSAIGVGPGLGKDQAAKKSFADAVALAAPMCIDADALSFIAERAPPNAVLTPHPLEFARLFGGEVETIQRARIDSALAAAQKSGAVVVLKGEGTVVASPLGEWGVCESGDRALAKGGTGDVLCGLITGLLAQGYAPFVAACLGVYFHGRAGTFAARGAPASALASEVADALPLVMRGR